MSIEDTEILKFQSVEPVKIQEEEESTTDYIQRKNFSNLFKIIIQICTEMEAKAKKQSDNERYQQAFEIIVKGKFNAYNILNFVFLVIDFKQKSQTEHPEEIIEYAIKMCKIFNQFGMNLLNTQKYVES